MKENPHSFTGKFCVKTGYRTDGNGRRDAAVDELQSRRRAKIVHDVPGPCHLLLRETRFVL